MGVEGVASPGPGRSEPAPIRTPLPRAGPDLIKKREAEQGVRAESKPQQKAPLASPEAPRIAALATSGPKRAGTRLSVDAQTKRIVAQIVDETNAIIKQIPPEELLRVVARSRKIQAQLFDEMA